MQGGSQDKEIEGEEGRSIVAGGRWGGTYWFAFVLTQEWTRWNVNW